ncbi:VOC family protein [Algoriphagus sediminis]|uniref:VOC family protein n=1 Tax=Algoriphagus sediminis TaxID=3057113 RepID=A0ABT7YHC0_9BACT|nr:VOC family protein [Algoriphagus sediminis]MDN3205923.1 VOC family protein [Algoriphagus sediminis]
MKIFSYLNFDGKAEEAMKFYQSILGGEFPMGFMYMGDMPDGPPMSDEDKKRVMHVTLQLDDGLVLMGSDTFPGFGPPLQKGNQTHLYLDLPSKEAVDDAFGKLAEGGSIEMPLEETFWGSYFGNLTDKYGICWMLNYDLKKEEA